MLSHPYRLTDSRDFDLVKREGQYYKGRFVGIGVRDRGDEESPRIGFVVSSKVSNFASIRNKVKRALRDAIRQEVTFFKKGHDVVIVAYPETARAYTDDIMKDVLLTIRKTTLLR